jgi:hypothetical protein
MMQYADLARLTPKKTLFTDKVEYQDLAATTETTSSPSTATTQDNAENSQIDVYASPLKAQETQPDSGKSTFEVCGRLLFHIHSMLSWSCCCCRHSCCFW